MLQVSRRSINNWIEQGRISAFKTPGGHRRVRVRDLVDFLVRSCLPIPKDLAHVSKQRMMVVDDDPRLLRAVKRRLARHAPALDLMLVESGIDALVEIGAFQPHVVVLDIFMPELDGIEVCRRLKAGEKTKHISVIMCSGQLTPELEARALEAGARMCLRKPLDFGELARDLLLANVEVADA